MRIRPLLFWTFVCLPFPHALTHYETEVLVIVDVFRHFVDSSHLRKKKQLRFFLNVMLVHHTLLSVLVSLPKVLIVLKVVHLKGLKVYIDIVNHQAFIPINNLRIIKRFLLLIDFRHCFSFKKSKSLHFCMN